MISLIKEVPKQMGFKLTCEISVDGGDGKDMLSAEFCKIVASKGLDNQYYCAKTFAWNYIKSTLSVDSTLVPDSRRAVHLLQAKTATMAYCFP
jgi:hypothetical protein